LASALLNRSCFVSVAAFHVKHMYRATDRDHGQLSTFAGHDADDPEACAPWSTHRANAIESGLSTL
jgi:hypothetical protein